MEIEVFKPNPGPNGIIAVSILDYAKVYVPLYPPTNLHSNMELNSSALAIRENDAREFISSQELTMDKELNPKHELAANKELTPKHELAANKETTHSNCELNPCSICQTAMPVFAYKNCMHLRICLKCRPSLADMKCPVCREVSDEIVRVYY